MNPNFIRQILPTVFALSFSAFVSPATADLVEQGPKDSRPSGLLAGVARADITPPVGIGQMNWGSQSHILSEGNDPVGLCVTALVLSDGRSKFATVDIDRLFVTGLEPAIDRAAERTGIPAAHIRLGATHTHAAVRLSAAKGPAGVDLKPYQDVVERYDRYVMDQIVGAIIAANDRLEPAHIFGDKGVGRININRRVRAQGNNPPAVGRNPKGFVDRDLIVFRIDNAKGNPLAVIANFPCHGTVMAYENKFVSADWVGTLRTVVERAMPTAKCLFFQGAAGNQGPVEGFTGDLKVAHRLGSILGHTTASVALGIETVKREPTFEGFVESTAYQAKQHWRVKGPRDSQLKHVSKIIELPRRKYTKSEISSMDRRLRLALIKAKAAGETGDAWKIHQANSRVRRFRDLLTEWRQPIDPSPVKVQVEILRIGEVAIVSMPGEPFAEIGVAVRKASPFAVTMFCGYSDGIGGGYLPVTPEYSFGGYEVERSPYGKGADEKLIKETIALFDSVK